MLHEPLWDVSISCQDATSKGKGAPPKAYIFRWDILIGWWE